MPNQYTKFQTAVEKSAPLEFRFRIYDVKKQTKARKPRKSTKKSPLQNNKSPSKQSHYEGDSVSAIRACPSSSLVQYLPSGGLRIDPFRAYPVSPDHSELAVLDHFLHIMAPSGKQNVILPHRARTAHMDPHVNLLLPYVMQEAPLFDALLATCQASMSLSSGLSVHADRFFIVHRGRAMAGVREKLLGCIDTSLMLSVALLMICDYLTGDSNAVAGHSRALQRILKLMGDLPMDTPWNRFVSSGVQAFSSIGYIMTGTIPRDDCVRARNPLDDLVDPTADLYYPLPPFVVAECERWSQLPRGFCDLVLGSQISTQLATVVCAIDNLTEGDEDRVKHDINQLHPIQAAIQRFSQNPQATYLERCAAAGMWAYTFQFPRIQAPNLFHDPPMQGFTRLFSVSYRPASNVERDLIIWAHMSVYGFASLRASPLPGSREIFRNAISQHDIMKSWSKLKPVLSRFFCDPQAVEWWRVCHSSFSTPLSSTGIPTSTIPSSLAAIESPISNAKSRAHELDEPSQLICPVSGISAKSANGEAMPCPFRQMT